MKTKICWQGGNLNIRNFKQSKEMTGSPSLDKSVRDYRGKRIIQHYYTRKPENFMSHFAYEIHSAVQIWDKRYHGLSALVFGVWIFFLIFSAFTKGMKLIYFEIFI